MTRDNISSLGDTLDDNARFKVLSNLWVRAVLLIDLYPNPIMARKRRKRCLLLIGALENLLVLVLDIIGQGLMSDALSVSEFARVVSEVGII